ncbi:MAG: PA0069 family radical SAM protein [Phycisphaerae bacterium]
MPTHPSSPSPIKGRGTDQNPANRFESSAYAPDPDPQPPAPDDVTGRIDAPRSLPLTQVLPDKTQSIITSNDSPDVPFTFSINVYRGCEHGCIYCFARPTHEYLGLSAGLDFETKILVKHEAPALLRAELASKKWNPEVIAMSGVTDCYQPLERKLELTRRCLEVLLEARNPVAAITKNHLVTRDIDLFKQLREFNCIRVFISVTTLNNDIARTMEPRASSPKDRLDAIAQLAAAGIPVGVMVAPVVPAITDHEIPSILKAAKDAGAQVAGFVPLRLPFGLKDLFSNWLDQHFPDRKEKVLNRIRDLRGGKLNDPNFKTRMRGQGLWADHIAQSFRKTVERLNMTERAEYGLTTAHFRRPLLPNSQFSLFE